MTAFPSWFPFSPIFQVALLPFSATTAKRSAPFSIRTKSEASLKTRAARRGISNSTARDFIVSPVSSGTNGILDLSNRGSDSYREFQIAARYQVARHVLNASYVRSRAFGDLNDFNKFFGNLALPVIQPDARGRLPFDAP